MAVFLSELFPDADGVRITDRSAATGGAWSALDFQVLVSTALTDISVLGNNGIARASSRASRLLRNAADPTQAEYSITMPVHIGALNTVRAVWAMMGRATDTGTASTAVDGYFAGIQQTSTGVADYVLGKIVSGTVTELDREVGTVPTSDTVVLVLELLDASKSLKVDGVTVCSSADNTITQTGRVAIQAPDNGEGSIDYVTAETISGGGGGGSSIAAIAAYYARMRAA